MKTLAQQIAELDDVQPKEFDPEEEFPDRQSVNDDASDDGQGASNAAREHYLDVGPSSLRRINLDLDGSDAKYNGVRTSRQQLLEDDEHDSPDDDNEPNSDKNADDSDDDVSGSSDGGSSHDANDQLAPPPIDPAHPSQSLHEQDLTSALQASRRADRQKGKAISRQLRLWDSMVDSRIKLQKAITSTNVLPTPGMTEMYRTSSSRVSTLVDSVLREALALSDELFALQETLSNGQDVSLPPRKRRKVDESEETPIQDFNQQVLIATEAFASVEAALHPHHLLTLQKWSSKVQTVTPLALSKRTSFRQQAAPPKSVVDLIAEGLEEGSVGRAKAVGRTRIRRGQLQARLGFGAGGSVNVGDPVDVTKTPGPQEGDAETFDDTDFYQEILRDVIHAKSGTLTVDGWEAAKPKKLKKVVDTKASKGRKLRYEVHEKLQNFMVPVTPRGAWHNEQIDELFSSLMGAGFSSMPQLMDDTPNESPGVDLGGLRVF